MLLFICKQNKKKQFVNVAPDNTDKKVEVEQSFVRENLNCLFHL